MWIIPHKMDKNNYQKSYNLMENNETHEYVFKVIVVGDNNVGKTSIISKFAQTQFKETCIPAIGATICEKVLYVNETPVKFLIYDITGQEQFYNMREYFYHGSHGVLLVFDITNSTSFNDIRIWYQNIKKYLGDRDLIIGTIIGNKNDMMEKRKVKKKIAINLSNEISFNYFETSALTGENIEDIFKEIGKALTPSLHEEYF
jgi:Ras-related protein Rab-1A